MQYIHIKEYICQYMCLRLDLEYWTCKKWDTHIHTHYYIACTWRIHIFL